MTEFRVDFDENVWVPVPAEPDDGWRRALVKHYERRLGTVSGEIEDALVAFAEACAAARTENTGALLAFCPLELIPAIGILAIAVEEADDDVDLEMAAARDDEAQLAPAVAEIDGGWWGSGRRAAVIVASTDPHVAGGRFNYAFQRGRHVLLATATADRVPFATAMLPFADRMVPSVVLEDA
jgi:hypothetical protein